MTDPKQCSQCGNVIPVNAPAGVCPLCLMKAAIPTDDLGHPSKASTTAGRGHFVPPDADDLAKLFPQLEILELLGRGGMGAVYRARQPSLDRLVAVKILPLEVGADPAFAERFTREAQALARLSHQHIVSVFDFGQAEGLWYFVMEYVDGANLRQLLDTGDISPETALAIVPQICEALQFAHSEGVVHRDIKPENILLDKQGRVRIADFGLAKLLGGSAEDPSLTHTNQVMGTPQYMAPEQMRGSRAVDHRADIYSLGVVFYEMLTGELPVGRFEVPSKKSRLDARLDEVILRALESRPDLRYQHASDVKSDIESIGPLTHSNQSSVVTTTDDERGQQHPTAEHVQDRVQTDLAAPSMIMIVFGLLVAVLHAVTIGIGLQNEFDDDLAWIGIPGLVVGLTIFAGGLSLRNLWSIGCVYLGAIAALIPVGPGWLLTAYVGIWVLNVLSRPPVREAFSRRGQLESNRIEPRSSVKAVIGAAWASFFFAAVFCMVYTSNVQSVPPTVAEYSSPNTTGGAANAEIADQPGAGSPTLELAWWHWVLIVMVLPLGVTSPIGTTTLGLLAISDIRHSEGRRIGMPLAVADVMFFPLLILDTLIVLVAFWLVDLTLDLSDPSQHVFSANIAVPTLLVSICFAAVIDFILVQWVWGRATSKVSKV